MGTSTCLCVWECPPTGIKVLVLLICGEIVCVFRKLNLNGRFGVLCCCVHIYEILFPT